MSLRFYLAPTTGLFYNNVPFYTGWNVTGGATRLTMYDFPDEGTIICDQTGLATATGLTYLQAQFQSSEIYDMAPEGSGNTSFKFSGVFYTLSEPHCLLEPAFVMRLCQRTGSGTSGSPYGIKEYAFGSKGFPDAVTKNFIGSCEYLTRTFSGSFSDVNISGGHVFLVLELGYRSLALSNVEVGSNAAFYFNTYSSDLPCQVDIDMTDSKNSWVEFQGSFSYA